MWSGKDEKSLRFEVTRTPWKWRFAWLETEGSYFCGSTVGQITWFQYGANTYIVENVDGTTGIDAGDVAIKLTGLIDLSNATYNATTDILTIA